MHRTKNFGVVSFASDADRIDAIASFFPFTLFLVAALVALTTMTRMVARGAHAHRHLPRSCYRGRASRRSTLIHASSPQGLGSVSRHRGALPGAALGHHGGLLHRSTTRPAPPCPSTGPSVRSPRPDSGIGIALFGHPRRRRGHPARDRSALTRRRRPRPASAACWSVGAPVAPGLLVLAEGCGRNSATSSCHKRRLIMTCGIAPAARRFADGPGAAEFSSTTSSDVQQRRAGGLQRRRAPRSDDAADDESEASPPPSRATPEKLSFPWPSAPPRLSMIAQGVDGNRGHDHSSWHRPTPRRSRSCGGPPHSREGHDARWGQTDVGAIVTEKLATKPGLSAGDAIVFAEQGRFGQCHGDDLVRARDGYHRGTISAIMPS
ncbi:MAG: hypothetical protein ACLTDR_14940 [Adlercreutzia equolifaciens]